MNYKDIGKGLLMGVLFIFLVIFGLGVCAGVSVSAGELLGPEIWYDDVPHKILDEEKEDDFENPWPAGYWDESGVFFKISDSQEEPEKSVKEKHFHCLGQGSGKCDYKVNKCFAMLEKGEFGKGIQCWKFYNTCMNNTEAVCVKAFPLPSKVDLKKS